MRDMDGSHAVVCGGGSGTSAVGTKQQQIETFPIFPERYLISIGIGGCNMDTGLAFNTNSQ